jgi:hypothetical protein
VPSTPERIVRLRDALDPFDGHELRRLARYCAKASELRESQFLAEPQTIEASVGEPGPLTYEITNASRAVVNAVVPPLRVLYTPQEAASFARVRSLLAQHTGARTSPSAAALHEALRSYKRSIADVMAFDPDMGMYNVNGGVVTVIHKPSTREIFEDWLYGEYLHDDEDRLDRIDAWRSIGVHEFQFLQTMRGLATVYAAFATDLIQPILDQPALALAA